MRKCVLSVSLLVLLAFGAQAALITTISDALTAADSTMLGRISRDGVASEWSTSKPFPGVANPAVTYSYALYIVPISIAPYVQVSVDDPLASIFVSAYWGSFAPAPGPVATNYLGDAGSSGNPFGSPRFFQVLAPSPGNLVLMVSNVLPAGGGLGDPFSILVEGFTDTLYSDPVPEPLTGALVAGGLALLAVARKRTSVR